jgi:hypothetical protein
MKKNGDKILNHIPAPVAEAVPEVCLSAINVIKNMQDDANGLRSRRPTTES